MSRLLAFSLILFSVAIFLLCAVIAASDLYYRHIFGPQANRGGTDHPQDASPVEVGQAVYEQRCGGCHGIGDSSGVGPPLGGLYGSVVLLEDGSTFTADEDYIRGKIVGPSATVRAGYPDAMPSFGDRLSDEEIDGLVAFIKSVGEADD